MPFNLQDGIADSTPMLGRFCVAIAAVVLAAGLCGAAEGVAKRPDVIPLPREYRVDGPPLALAEPGGIRVAIGVDEHATDKEALGADWIAKEVKALTGLSPPVVRHPTNAGGGCARILLGVYAGGRPLDKAIEAQLEGRDVDVLSDPLKTEQAYVLVVKDNLVLIMGRSDQGTLYGAMTLLQLLQKDGDALRMPRVQIRDWPSFRYRVAENWTYAEGRERGGAGWCYDWGDGRERYEERVEKVFDRCLRYKINAIMFHGDFYGPLERMWDWRDLAFAKRLSQSARRRGIKLIFGGMGVGGDNRRAYPDGQVYPCVGYPDNPPTRTRGTCRGNDSLNAMKRSYVEAFVEHLEPGGLYVHFEDLANYEETAACWKLRCDTCRKRWPNDDLNAVDGGAAGFAHGYDQFCDAVFRVKNEASGYDASRDTVVILVSPGYTAAGESDADWDAQVAYWTKVSQLLKYKENVNLCIREQFLRRDDNQRRVAQMARALRERGNGHGLFIFSLSFASLYAQGPLFQAYPATTNEINDGAETVYFFCGRIFQEPQILLNADWMWNGTPRAGLELPPTASAFWETFRAYRSGKLKPRAIHGPGGYLEKACTRLYGEEAGRQMKRLYELEGQPVCYGRRVLHKRDDPDHDWRVHREATRKAIDCVAAALSANDLRQENRWILERFLEALRLGERFSTIRVDYQELRAMAEDDSVSAQALDDRCARIEAGIKAMEDYINDRFPSRWVTPNGGDFAYWHSALMETRDAVKTWRAERRPAGE